MTSSNIGQILGLATAIGGAMALPDKTITTSPAVNLLILTIRLGVILVLASFIVATLVKWRR